MDNSNPSDAIARFNNLNPKMQEQVIGVFLTNGYSSVFTEFVAHYLSEQAEKMPKAA